MADVCKIGAINVAPEVKKTIDALSLGDIKTSIQLAEYSVSEDFIKFREGKDRSLEEDLLAFARNGKMNIKLFTSYNAENNFGGFTSAKAIEDARGVSIFMFNSIKNKYLQKGIKPNFKQVVSSTYSTLINSIKKELSPDIINKYKDLDADEQAKAIIEECLTNKDINNKTRNKAALAYQLKNNWSSWYIGLKNRDAIKTIFFENNEDIENQEFEDYENNLDEFESDISDYDDQTDLSSKAWTENIGDKTDSLKHINKTTKEYIQLLPQINSATANENGKFDIDRNNELGLAIPVSYNETINFIRAYADFSNKDTFIASLTRAANNIYEARILAKIAKDVNDNPDLFNALWNCLALPTVPKLIMTIQDENRRLGVSNINSTAQGKLLYLFLNNVKSTAFNNDQVDYSKELTELAQLVGSISSTGGLAQVKERFIRLASNIINQYLPDVTIYALSSYINDGDVQTKAASLLSDINDLIRNSKRVVAEYYIRKQEADKIRNANRLKREAGDTNLIPYPTYENEINYPVSGTLANLANKLTPYMAVRTETNSRNAEGNMSSDVINANYIMNIAQRLNNPEQLKQFMKFKTQGDYYRFSNILYEQTHTLSNGQVITTPGLFIKDSDGTVRPTDYAQDLLNIYLFNGATDIVTQTSVLYSGMTAMDYFTTSIEAYNTSLRDSRNSVKGINFATYFFRIPSDAPKNFMINAPKYSIEGLINSDKTINDNHVFVKLFSNVVKGEIRNLYSAFNKMFRKDGDTIVLNKKDNQTDEEFINNFQERYFYNKTALKNGRPTGNVFNLKERGKLKTINGYNIYKEFDNIIEDIYNQGNNITDINAYLDSINETIEQAVNNWINEYIKNSISNYHINYYSNNQYNDNLIAEWALNTYLVYTNMDDLFEGDAKYYKSAQDFLKRDKEIQAGGKPYYSDKNLPIGEANFNQGLIFKNGDFEVNDSNAFRALTINNAVRPSLYATNLYNQLLDAKVPEKQARNIAIKYGDIHDKDGKLIQKMDDLTKADDAQSYITLEEFVRRMYKRGNLEQYRDLITQLTNPNVDIKTLDPNKLNSFIQVLKHFYYDVQYDATNDVYYPRQIKNAELVLIPAFIKDTDLGRIYDFMKQNSIDQLNTTETSKAAKKNVINLFDEQGNIADLNDPAINKRANDATENYFYEYLYTQQDVPQHLVNARNKAGIQIMKKIIDNLEGKGAEHRDNFFKIYTTKIKRSFDKLVKELDIELDKNGKIINKGDFLEKIMSMSRDEVNRLGLDSNFIDYLTIYGGQPVMPTFMNLVSSKIESIVQSIFNSRVTRQKLPGWHAAQVTNVLYGGYKLDKAGNKLDKLRFHPEEKDENGNVITQAYAEVLLPKWASTMFNKYDADGNLIKEINIEDVDEEVLKCIGYRIPTEGKQSISVLKVVGFLPEAMGSAIVVPDEWVAQTGSDFDVDSVYGIAYETYYGKDGRVHKIEYIENPTDKDNEKLYIQRMIDELDINTFKAINKDCKLSGMNLATALDEHAKNTGEGITYGDFVKLPVEARNSEQALNNRLLDIMIDIMEMPESREENLGSSNFMNLTEGKNWVENIIESSNNINDYNPIKFNVYDRNTASRNNSTLYIFTDNTDRNSGSNPIDNNSWYAKKYGKDLHYPTQTTAVIRGLPNARPISTQKHYNNEQKGINGRWNDNDFDEFKKVIDNEFKEIINEWNTGKYTDIVFPGENIDSLFNTRISNISEERTPRIYNYLRNKINELFNQINNSSTNKPKIISSRANRSPYSPFDQIAFMEDAMSGARLKAFSVTRDTFNSVNNVAKTTIIDDSSIYVTYDLTDQDNEIQYDFKGWDTTTSSTGGMTVKHNTIGWSKNNNRNIVGMLLTPYSSQTTAHILDAIKEGAIPNENEYTFAAFKTLVDVGIDYRTAILFLRQPAINRIIKAVNENNSVYVSGNFNPIHAAIKELAIEYGINIKDNTPIDKVIEAIKSRGYNINIKTEEINGVHIDNKANKERFKSTDKDNNFEHDLKVIEAFNKLQKLGADITALARVCNPDRFGAKQTIFATRKTLENIDEYRGNKGIANKFITKTGENIINSIYYPEEGIESVYPSLKAFLDYATRPSVQINSMIFDTESDNFISVVKSIGGKRISEKTYNNIKKYLIANSYKQNPYMTSILTTDRKTGEIVLVNRDELGFIDDITELTRCFGYYNPLNTNFVPENNDYNNPTVKDVMTFLSYSPAQKVQWLKQHILNEGTILDYINVNLYNETTTKGGHSPQTLEFNDAAIDKETAYNLFRELYNSSNWYIKQTALDIIKYAFMVEGYNFTRKSIGKIIPNDCLLDIHAKNQTNSFIETVRNDIQNIIPDENIKTNYIRSHSDNNEIIIKGRKRCKSLKVTNYGVRYIDLSTEEGRNDAEYLGIAYKTNNGDIEYRDFINLPVTINKQTNYIPYKAIKLNNKVWFYPLNKLESWECSKWSVNPTNNIYYDSEFYQFVIQQLDTNLEYFNNYRITQESLDAHRYIPPVRKRDMSLTSDANQLEVAAQTDKNIKDFIDEINRSIGDVELAAPKPNTTTIYNQTQSVAKFIPKGTNITQVITNSKGERIVYKISDISINPRDFKTIKSLTDYLNGRTNKIDRNLKPVADKLKQSTVSYTGNVFTKGIYKIDALGTEETYNSDISGDEVFSNIGGNETLISNPNAAAVLGKTIWSSINRIARERNSVEANKVLRRLKARGINANDYDSFQTNAKIILGEEAKYVEETVNRIEKQIDSFDIYDVPIDDPTIIELLNNDDFRLEYIRFALDIKNFGRDYGNILYADSSIYDPEIAPYIKRIQDALNRLYTNSKANIAINKIVDWIGSKVSTDPRLQKGWMTIREQFGDAGFFDWILSDLSELNNSSVQNIVKYVMTNIYSERDKGVKAAREFKARVAEIRAKYNIDFNKFIKDGNLLYDYDTAVNTVLNDLATKRSQIKEEKGINSVEYHEADIAYRKFLAENFEQEYDKQYYIDVVNNDEELFNANKQFYVAYKKLSRELGDIINEANINGWTKDITKRFFAKSREIKYLSDPYNDSNINDEARVTNAIRLNKYRERVNEINETYFDKIESPDFKKNLDKYLSIVETLQKTDTHDNLMKNDIYAEAYEWIANNTRKRMKEEFKKEYDKHLKVLREDKAGKSNSTIPRFGDYAYNEDGSLNPIKLTEEDILRAKTQEENKYLIGYSDGTGVQELIRYRKSDSPVYNSSLFKDDDGSDLINKNNNPRRIRVVGQINQILAKCVVPNSDVINTLILTEKELNKLADLYEELDNLNGGNSKLARKLNKLDAFRVKQELYEQQANLAKSKGARYYIAWQKANTTMLKDGSIVPNNYLYGYIELNDEKYIDKDKTAARDFMKANISYSPKPEWYQVLSEKRRALDEGRITKEEYDNWYNNNTIADPFNRTIRPLRIWLNTDIKEAPDGTSNIEYVPSFNQSTKEIKSKYINKNFVSNGGVNAYNYTNQQYNIDLGLNEGEKQYRQEIVNLMTRLSGGYTKRAFVKDGKLPRKRRDEPFNPSKIPSYIAGYFGFSSFNPDISGEWKVNIDYSHDRQTSMPMTDMIKAKGYKEEIPIPAQNIGESDNDYQKRIEEIRKENETIRLNNAALEKAVLSDDWDNIFTEFIEQAYDYNAKQEQKLYLQVLMNSLRINKAVSINGFNNPRLNYDSSFDNQGVYDTVEQQRTIELVDTFYHRLIRNEYRKNSFLNKMATIFQNIASAKFMMFNVTGGIGNIATGMVNIMGEVFAREYFNAKEFNEASIDYDMHIGDYLMHWFDDKADSLTGALIKKFNVIDFEQVIGEAIDSTTSTAEAYRRFKEFAYSFQSMGEHMMQNKALLATLRSNRIWYDANGEKHIGSFELYSRSIDDDALIETLSKYPSLLEEYKKYINRSLANNRERAKILQFRINLNRRFIKAIKNNNVKNEYLRLRKEKLKNAKTEFNKLERVIDQFEFVNGYAEYKNPDKFGSKEFGQMRNKVISINNKIHGVYNKLGAARIESEWYGGIVMQFHKHIYPGILKRYRNNGMYNEQRETIETGAYRSFINWIGTEFADAHDQLKNKYQNKGEYLLAAVGKYLGASYKTLINGATNYNLLSENEKAGVRRTLADALGVTSALLLSIALYCINDDDEYDDTIWWNLLLYQADKLASESSMYSPLGLFTEVKTLYSSPLAIIPSIEDLAKIGGLGINYLINGDDFNPYYETGQYAGENKFKVYVYRNIPVYRTFNRLMNLADNNSYYRIGETIFDTVPTEKVADALME